jgi:hypothetical protein
MIKPVMAKTVISYARLSTFIPSAPDCCFSAINQPPTPPSSQPEMIEINQKSKRDKNNQYFYL